MIIWLALFLIIIIISFVLAYNSMKDFEEIPHHATQSIFLIRNIAALNYGLFNNLHQELLKNQSVISVERIFKGSKAAYILVGPKNLETLLPELNLLELEDYAEESAGMIVWDLIGKDKIKFHLNTEEQLANFSESLPTLTDAEQLWLQLIIKPEKGNIWQKLGDKKLLKDQTADPAIKEYALEKEDKVLFTADIRLALKAEEPRLKELVDSLTNLSGGNLVKLPRPLSTTEMFNLYKKRGFFKDGKDGMYLTGDEIVSLLTN